MEFDMFGMTASNPFEMAKRKRQRLRPGFDAHDRDYAPLLQHTRFMRKYHIATDKLAKNEELLRAALEPGESLPKMDTLVERMEKGKEAIVKGDALIKSCRKLLGKLDERMDENNERSAAARQEVVQKLSKVFQKLSKVFPLLRDDLTKLQTKIDGELYRLSIQNTQFAMEIGQLKAAATIAVGANGISERLEKYLNEKDLESTHQEGVATTSLKAKVQEFDLLQIRSTVAREEWDAQRAGLVAKIELLSEERSELKQRSRQLERENKDLIDAKDQANTDLYRAQHELQDLENVIIETRNSKDTETARANDLQQASVTREATVESYAQTIEKLTTEIDHAKQLAIISENKFDTLNLQNESLKSAYQITKDKIVSLETEMEAEESYIDEILEAGSQVTNELARVRVELEKSQAKCSDSDAQNTDLRDQNTQLTQALADKTVDWSTIVAEHADLEQRLAIQSEESTDLVDQLRDDMETIQEENEDMVLKIGRFRHANGQLADLYNNLHLEYDALDLQAQQDHLQSVQQQEQLNATVTQLRDERDLAREGLRVTQEQMTTLRRERDSLDLEILDRTEAAERAVRIFNETMESIKMLREEKEEVDAQLLESRELTDIVREQRNDLDRQYREAKASGYILEEEKADLESDLKDSNERGDLLAKEKGELEAEIAKIIESGDLIAKEKRDLEIDLAKAIESGDTLTTEKGDLEVKLANANESGDLLTKEKDRLMHQLDTAYDCGNLLVQQKTDLTVQLAKANDCRDLLMKEKSDLQIQLATAVESEDLLTKEKRDLEVKLTNANESGDLVAREKGDLEIQLAKTVKSGDCLQTDIDAIQLKLHDANASIDRLGMEKHSVQQILDKANGIIADLQKTKTALDSKIGGLEKDKDVWLKEKLAIQQELDISNKRLGKERSDWATSKRTLTREYEQALAAEKSQTKHFKDVYEKEAKECIRIKEASAAGDRICKIHSEQYTSLQDSHNELVRQYNSLLENFKQHRATIEDLYRTIETMVKKKEYDELKNEATTIAIAHAGCADTITGLESTIENMVHRTTFNQLKTNAEATSLAYSECVDKISGLESTIRQMVKKDEFDELAAKAETLALQHEKCHPRISELQLEIGTMVQQSKYDQLKIDADATTASHAGCARRIYGLESIINDMIPRVDFDKLKCEAADKITALESAIQDMVPRVDFEQLKCDAAVISNAHIGCASSFASLNTALQLSVPRIELDNSRRELMALQSEMKSMVSASVYAQLSQAVQDITTEHGQCAGKLSELQSTIGNMVHRTVFDQLKENANATSIAHALCAERITALESTIQLSVPRIELEQLRNDHSTCEQRLTDALSRVIQTPRRDSIASDIATYDISRRSSVSERQSPYSASPYAASPYTTSPYAAGPSRASPMPAPRFGPPLHQVGQSSQVQQPPANTQYTFLVAGSMENGPRTILVSQSTINMMEAQIARWNTKIKGQAWSVKSFASHRRCVDTRRLNIGTTKNPPTSDKPNVACTRCIKNNILCVLVGADGPVVVPLPISDRSIGATPTSGAYFVKDKEKE